MITKRPRKKYVTSRIQKMADNCVHNLERAYSLGLCKNCYHSHGRKKQATECDHVEKIMYAWGLCKGCYLK